MPLSSSWGVQSLAAGIDTPKAACQSLEGAASYAVTDYPDHQGNLCFGIQDSKSIAVFTNDPHGRWRQIPVD